jgi:hypothetical protein
VDPTDPEAIGDALYEAIGVARTSPGVPWGDAVAREAVSLAATGAVRSAQLERILGIRS